MRKFRFFVIPLAVLMLGIVACGDDSNKTEDVPLVDIERVTETVVVIGEVVEVRFVDPNGQNDSTSDTLIRLLDSSGGNHYLAMSGIQEAFSLGQIIVAKYEMFYWINTYSDGTTENSSNDFKRGYRRTIEAQHNEDGSISFVKVKWIFVGAEDMTILPS